MKPTDIIKIRMISELLNNIQIGFEDTIEKLRSDLHMKPYHLFTSIVEYIISGNFKDKLNTNYDYYRLINAYALNVYDASGDTIQIPVLKQVIKSDMKKVMSEDEILSFEEKGWEL